MMTNVTGEKYRVHWADSKEGPNLVWSPRAGGEGYFRSRLCWRGDGASMRLGEVLRHMYGAQDQEREGRWGVGSRQ